MDTRGKKTAAAIHAEVIREVDRLLHVLFNGRRKTGHGDLEASEMMMRSAMHRAGVAGTPSAIRIPPPTPVPSNPLRSLVSESTWKPGSADGQILGVGAEGILDVRENTDLRGAVADQARYRSMFHTPAYIRRVWPKWFEVLDILPGWVANNQDLGILRAREGS